VSEGEYPQLGESSTGELMQRVGFKKARHVRHDMYRSPPHRRDHHSTFVSINVLFVIITMGEVIACRTGGRYVTLSSMSFFLLLTCLDVSLESGHHSNNMSRIVDQGL
jgi:hypothetical protein